MPQVIVRYWERDFPEVVIGEIGKLIRPIVATATSTAEMLFTENDIEWLPQPYHPASIGGSDFALELRTFGKPERKEHIGYNDRIGNTAVQNLKTEILRAINRLRVERYPDIPEIDPAAPLIWIIWIDPDGLHV